jgi:hypothetical protein
MLREQRANVDEQDCAVTKDVKDGDIWYNVNPSDFVEYEQGNTA